MIFNDKEQFAKIIIVLSEYYGKTMSDGVVELYWQELKEFDISAIDQAVRRHMSNPESGQYMPKISDIKRMIGGSTQDTALRAWAKVDKALREIGPYVDVAFPDELIHRVLYDMGGWIALGNKTEDEWPFVAREFENRYRGFKMRGETPEYPSILTGIANTYNRSKGLPLEPYVMIGDETACQRVIAGGTDKPLIGFKQAGKAATELSLVFGTNKKAREA